MLLKLFSMRLISKNRQQMNVWHLLAVLPVSENKISVWTAAVSVVSAYAHCLYYVCGKIADIQGGQTCAAVKHIFCFREA